MSVDAEALRRHAALVSAEQLGRANGRLRVLSPDEEETVSEAIEAIVERIVRCLLEEAEREASVAEALTSIYGSSLRGPGGPAARVSL